MICFVQSSRDQQIYEVDRWTGDAIIMKDKLANINKY